VPPLKYWVLRLCRRATPQPVVNFLLDRGIVLKPGKETSDPEAVAALYAQWLSECGQRLKGKTVCVVGYGGSAGIGVYLLEQGARRVILQDPFAPPRKWRIGRLPARLMQRYFRREGGEWVPDPDRLEQVHESLAAYAARNPGTVDFILSRSVLEHVDDLDGLVAACWELTRRGGLNIHLVNLQDHVSAYPFEMLCYGSRTWKRWLNASNNLNRLRTGAYREIFQRHFSSVGIGIMESKLEQFREIRPRIRPEFLTGDDEADAAALIRVDAKK